MFDDLRRTISLRRTFNAAIGGRRVIVVSNRGPVEHRADNGESPRPLRGAGGLVTAVAALERLGPITWLAAPASDADRRIAEGGTAVAGPAGPTAGHLRLRYVPLSADVQELHYNVFANPMLWFLHHGIWRELRRPDLGSELRRAWRDGYVPANEAFARAVVNQLRRPENAPLVLFQDYHLYLAPASVRRAAPNAVLQHFVHVPWPAPEAWRSFPWAFAAAICQSLLANDIVRFQTEADARNFLATCRELLPTASVDDARRVVYFGARRTLVKVSPVSVDVQMLQFAAESPDVQRHRRRLAALAPGRTIVRVDRLDPAKNIIAGLQAFDRLLKRRPGEMDDVTLLAFLVPSRRGIAEYDEYARETFALAEAINRRHSHRGRPRVRIFHEHNYEQALAGMMLYDVLLVNPRADGMNLVSKEGPIINRRDGALVLSTAAGSWQELRGAALGVHPEDVTGTEEALARALTMPRAERAQRAAALRERIGESDLLRWVEEQAADLAALATEVPRIETSYARAGTL